MNNFVYVALVVFLGIVVVQGYGPKIYRKHHGSSQKSSHGSRQRSSHGSSHRGPSRHGSFHQGPSHHGSFHHGSSEHGSFRKPALLRRPIFPPRQDIGTLHQAGHWDNSPVWKDDDGSFEISRKRSGSYDSSDYDSHGPDDDSYGPGDDSSYGPDDSSGPNDSSINSGSSSSEGSGPSDEDNSWYDQFHSKVPCKKPHTKPPKRPTTKIPPHTPKPRPKPTRGPRPKPTEPPRPKPTRGPRPKPTEPPRPETTRFTPHPTTDSSTPSPRPTRSTGSTGTIWQPNTPTEATTLWETTTSAQETTTEGEEEITTISPEITNCIASCASTPEYNPVCGSNGQTYDNEGKLFCANSCGVNVTLRRRSVCPPPSFDYDDNGDQPPPTTPPPTTLSPSFGRTTALSGFQKCMKSCRITASVTPVCGSDFNTYMNMDRLKCAQSCGEVIHVICEKPCIYCGLNPVTPKTTTLLPTTTSSSNVGRTTLEPSIKECIDKCPSTQEYNPVCGSDRVTYKNPGHLLCAQLCGLAISVSRFGPCPPTTPTTLTTPTTTEATSATYSPAVLNCIRRCPVTSEYNPVCGTDDLTYTNTGNLECAKYCGANVELKYKSRCIDEFDLGPDVTASTSSQSTPKVNGAKDVLTSTEKSTSLFTSPTTVRSTTTKTTPIITTVTTPTTSSTTLGFSIPQDVLDTIFKSTTPGIPLTTKPTTKNPDEDEDLDLDARFGKETTTVDTTESVTSGLA